jgi:hypothetical protein
MFKRSKSRRAYFSGAPHRFESKPICARHSLRARVVGAASCFSRHARSSCRIDESDPKRVAACGDGSYGVDRGPGNRGPASRARDRSFDRSRRRTKSTRGATFHAAARRRRNALWNDDRGGARNRAQNCACRRTRGALCDRARRRSVSLLARIAQRARVYMKMSEAPTPPLARVCVT